jgi:hypothetical protein
MVVITILCIKLTCFDLKPFKMIRMIHSKSNYET